MSEKVKIRAINENDFETVYDFINILENKTFEKEQQKLIFIENVNSRKNIYLLAVIRDEPVGFLSCHTQNLLHHGGLIGEIQEMFVNPNNRKTGIGNKLISKLKSLSKKRGIIQLEVTSNIKRELAHEFYERQNFINTHKKFVCYFK